MMKDRFVNSYTTRGTSKEWLEGAVPSEYTHYVEVTCDASSDPNAAAAVVWTTDRYNF